MEYFFGALLFSACWLFGEFVINLSPVQRRSVGIGVLKGVGWSAVMAATLALVIWSALIQ